MLPGEKKPKKTDKTKINQIKKFPPLAIIADCNLDYTWQCFPWRKSKKIANTTKTNPHWQSLLIPIWIILGNTLCGE